MMELTVTSIISFVTLIIGFVSKKFNLLDKKYIPMQNFIIGIISGFVIYITELELNIYSALITGLIASLSAGGIYDFMKVKHE